MRLFTRRIFSPVGLKNFSNFMKSNIIRTHYYTCLSGPIYVRLQKFDHHQISSLETMRKFNFDVKKANNFLMNTFDKVFAKQKYKQKSIGFLWYKTFEEINREEFFNFLQMPDTFFSWFKVLELHAWMLLFQMKQDGPTLRYIRDGVVEAMWLDLETRAKILEKNNKNIRKTFIQMYEKFRVSLFWYDYGYLESDIVLTTVVWNVFFERENDDPEKLEALVRYIRCQMNHLQSRGVKTVTENVMTGVWTPLKPHCKRFVT